jgi:hypothetical protein
VRLRYQSSSSDQISPLEFGSPACESADKSAT